MPFLTDQNIADEVARVFGTYLTTFTSRTGQVRADVFQVGREVRAHVSFPTGLEPTTVTDLYLSELWKYARDNGYADRFRLIYS